MLFTIYTCKIYIKINYTQFKSILNVNISLFVLNKVISLLVLGCDLLITHYVHTDRHIDTDTHRLM